MTFKPQRCQMTDMLRNFTHITIPAEIWLRKDISMQAKCLWAEIRSLHNKEAGGCFASDEYLCEFLQLQNRRFYYILKELKEAGLLESKSNGRQAIRVAIVPEVEYHTGQQMSGKPDNSSAQQKCRKVHRRSAEKCSSEVQKSAELSYIENKVENKVIDSAPSKDDAKKKPFSSSSSAIKKRKHVSLTEDQHQKLVAKYGASQTEKSYDFLDDWKSSKAESDPKALNKHTDYYRITKWVMKELIENPRSSFKKPSSKLSLPTDGTVDSPDAPWRKKEL